MIYEYKGQLYPDYLKQGGASQWIAPLAKHFCKGKGYDIGCGRWPLEGAIGVDLREGMNAMDLPPGEVDFIFSSHCLEHLPDPVKAIEYWHSRLHIDGVLFLYLPHPDMEYWRPQNCRKHLHQFWPRDMHALVEDLGFHSVISSERDLAWSFSVVGFKRG